MLANYNAKNNNPNAESFTDAAVSSNHRCCAERRLLDSWVGAARRHGVPSHKVVPWVRRKLGSAVVVLRFRGDGSLGCSVPCVLCQRELTRFDLQVHCFLGSPEPGTAVLGSRQDGGPGGAPASAGTGWFSGRLSDIGAPTPVLTAGQRRTLNIDPGVNRPKKGQASEAPPPARSRDRRSATPPPPPPAAHPAGANSSDAGKAASQAGRYASKLAGKAGKHHHKQKAARS